VVPESREDEGADDHETDGVFEEAVGGGLSAL
jgi:hypothetical protein